MSYLSVKKLIREFVLENYGESELENPSWDINALARHVGGQIIPTRTTFIIDDVNSDEEYLYVDIQGLGSVQIKAQPDGIVVDIYPLYVKDEPVASTYAHINDLVVED